MNAPKADPALLDNPVWHALRGPQARLAEATDRDRVVRFQREVSCFSAVERMDDAGWRALAALVGPEGAAILVRDAVPLPPPGWEELHRAPTWQLVGPPRSEGAAVPDLVELGADDVEEMLALTALTAPGPFFSRTLEMGRYWGVRRGGRLLAMAGQRFGVPGWTEISAVCTHPDATRRGLGAALTLHVAREIAARGDRAFLHVLETNENALRLYRALGFAVRRKVDVVVVRWLGGLGA